MRHENTIDGQAEAHLDAEESGIFTWSLETNVVQGDTRLASLFGIVPSAAIAGLPIETFLDRIHPEDRARVAKSIHHAILSGEPYHEVYRVLGQGGYADVAAFGRCYRGRGGTPSQYAGIAVKVGPRETEGDPLLSHIAMAHKIATDRLEVEVADALEELVEKLMRSPREIRGH